MERIEKVEKELSDLQKEVDVLKSSIKLANHSVSGMLIDLDFIKQEINTLRGKIEGKSLNIAEVQGFYIEKILEIKKDLAAIEQKLKGENE